MYNPTQIQQRYNSQQSIGIENANYVYNSYNAEIQIEASNKAKLEEFKQRIKPFENVKTLEEAKNLASKILPVSKDINTFSVGGAKCIIINNKSNFRISVQTATEFICYDFI